MNISIVAVDPGAQGYAVRLEIHREPLAITIEDTYSLVSYREMDYIRFNTWCALQARYSDVCVIEHPIPSVRGIGSGLLTQGINYGYALSACMNNFKEIQQISPNDWKKAFMLNKGKKGIDNHEAEHLAATLVGRQTLMLPRCRRPNAGLVDAVLIGYYGYLNFINEFHDDDQD